MSYSYWKSLWISRLCSVSYGLSDWLSASVSLPPVRHQTFANIFQTFGGGSRGWPVCWSLCFVKEFPGFFALCACSQAFLDLRNHKQTSESCSRTGRHCFLHFSYSKKKKPASIQHQCERFEFYIQRRHWNLSESFDWSSGQTVAERQHHVSRQITELSVGE